MKVNIDTDNIKILVDGANKIFLSPDGEQNLVQLYELQDIIEKAIAEAKLRIEAEAVKLDPQFSSIKGDDVKITYRYYGSRYKIDDTNVDQLPKELYNVKTTLTPNIDAIDEYIEKNDGKIPFGILESDRQKQVSITIKKDEK